MVLAPYSWLEKPADNLLKLKAKLPGAILIHGPRGSGTFELAAAFARSLLCRSPVNGSACGECSECKLIEAGNHPDFKMILSEAEEAIRPQPWAAPTKTSAAKKTLSRMISIEQIRSLSDFFAISSYRGGLRIVLIYPADMMMADQSSALLKTLEEPPADVLLILVSDNLDSMLPTIRSRCQLVRVAPPTQEQGIAFLRSQGVAHPQEELAKLGGLPLLYFEQDAKLRFTAEQEQQLISLLSLGAGLRLSDVVTATKDEFATLPLIVFLQRWCNDLILVASGQAPHYFLQQAPQLSAVAQRADIKKLFAFLDTLRDARRSTAIALNVRMIAQDLILQYARSCR